MADGIADFNPMDGLEPLVIQKLNNNFQSLLRMFMPLAINMVAQSEAPDPRTDETLWYDTDNGDLYIWAQVWDPIAGSFTDNWEWRKFLTDVLTLGVDDPAGNPPEGAVLYFNTTTKRLWVYSKADSFSSVGDWHTLEDYITSIIYFGFLLPSGRYHQWFVDAVHDAMNEQHS